MITKSVRGNRALGIMGATILVTAVTLTAPAPASAADFPCGGGASKTSTSTTSWMGGCQSTQARIDRYYAGLPRSYYGPQAAVSSVTASDGTLIGNAARFLVAGGSGPQWSSWIYF
ncbi:hypothetical protein Aph01nite_18320 [Acrocarpospora phusangensis]|uniref:Uncharacterized protein n=1 Tax=Acrocarpospora phusangensis TaxID=1070424 RepID=A0A919UMM8_9ACTN|nr:hypothetical protein [Acrocarpospora phusangensis]GIH23522.1 hypothetical protein Aph01nite_18320 [Acrocarpospora phusangensis]